MVDAQEPFVLDASEVTTDHELLHNGVWRSVVKADTAEQRIHVSRADGLTEPLWWTDALVFCVRNRVQPEPEVKTLREMLRQQPSGFDLDLDDAIDTFRTYLQREEVRDKAHMAAFIGLPECMGDDEARRRVDAAIQAIVEGLE